MAESQRPEDYFVLFGVVQTPKHVGWPIHGQLIVQSYQNARYEQTDYFLFSVEGIQLYMEERFTAWFHDRNSPVLPPTELTEWWDRETTRVLNEARALGFPETIHQLDRIWRHWRTYDGGENQLAKAMTRVILQLDTPTVHEGARRTPTLRCYAAEAIGLLDDVPGCPRVIHGKIDIGHRHTNERANAIFFSTAGALYSLQRLYTIGLLTDDDVTRIRAEIEASILPVTTERTRADRVASNYAVGHFPRRYNLILSHALGLPVKKKGRVTWDDQRIRGDDGGHGITRVYLWDEYMLGDAGMRSLEQTQSLLDKELKNGLLLPEEHAQLHALILKSPLGGGPVNPAERNVDHYID